MRSTSSSFVFTRIPFKDWRVSLLKNPSTRFSHEPCLGVNTRFASLTRRLLDEGRSEELLKAIEDKDYRDKLYGEYNL